MEENKEKVFKNREKLIETFKFLEELSKYYEWGFEIDVVVFSKEKHFSIPNSIFFDHSIRKSQ